MIGLALACGPPAPVSIDAVPEPPDSSDSPSPTIPDDTGTPPVSDTTPSTESSSTVDTVPTTETTLPPIDCEALAEEPLSITELSAPRGYHGLAFTTDGRIVGSDNANLVAVTYDDEFSVLSTGFGTVQQMDWLADGDLAVAVDSNNAIVRLNVETGAQDVVASNVGAYGVVLGPDDKLWTANNSDIVRIDPETGDQEELYREGPFTPHALGFDVGYARLFITTISGGSVWAWDLDDDHEPIGNPYEFAQDAGGWQDCVVVDSCGNLYVCDYTTSSLYRISPDGAQVGVFVNWSGTTYGHGATFGNGIGGWRKDAIYLPQPYDDDTVVEVVLGIGAANTD
jgi:sugar lactone lactonase YvrE